mmetsp:Transcript_13020/g.26013  ORF Transcript_13020/g.26013 Transcript_13020/m.26013 type:complete len:520 (-) Transcript_13020:118-1677(-)
MQTPGTARSTNSIESGKTGVSRPDDFANQKKKVDQRRRERDRIRAEHERTRQKEKELRQAEDERNKAAAEQKHKEIQEKREEAVKTKLAQRRARSLHQARILAEYQEEVKLKNAKRADKARELDAKILDGLESRSAEELALDTKGRALRRVFVILDTNCDGIITEADVRTRLSSLGCKMSKQAVAKMFHELEEMFGDEATGANIEDQYWKWAAYMHQPKPGGFVPLQQPSWSHRPDKGTASHPSLAELSKTSLPSSGKDKDKDDHEGVLRLYRMPPTHTHLNEIHAWTQTWPHRMVTTHCADSCSKREAQHPPTMSPRQPLDLAPQDPKSDSVCPVVLTEAGVMTEVDWRAHMLKTRDRKPGLCWTNFRDCFLTFSFQHAKDIPVKLLSIVEFLMVDTRGHGTASLEDAMELLFRRFGVPSDAMFTKLFGNSCDPTQQMRLSVYLEKVQLLVAHRRAREAAERAALHQEDNTASRLQAMVAHATVLSRLPSCAPSHTSGPKELERRMSSATPSRLPSRA